MQRNYETLMLLDSLQPAEKVMRYYHEQFVVTHLPGTSRRYVYVLVSRTTDHH